MSLRPSRVPGQPTTRHSSPGHGVTATLAVIRPSRTAVPPGRSAAPAAAIPLGQSSAAQTISGATLPSAPAARELDDLRRERDEALSRAESACRERDETLAQAEAARRQSDDAQGRFDQQHASLLDEIAQLRVVADAARADCDGAGRHGGENVGVWCSGGDLNPHAFRHTPLKRTCLPFHHPSKRNRDWRSVNVRWHPICRKGFVSLALVLTLVIVVVIDEPDEHE